MARKPNKYQRTLKRWRRSRSDCVDIPSEAELLERRPLAGFEGHYEITRTGHVWSVRLERFIKWAYDPSSARHWVQFSLAGEKQKIGVWRAVIESWLSIDEIAALRRAIPVEAHGSINDLKRFRTEINRLSHQHQLPSQFLFAFFLASD